MGVWDIFATIADAILPDSQVIDDFGKYLRDNGAKSYSELYG